MNAIQDIKFILNEMTLLKNENESLCYKNKSLMKENKSLSNQIASLVEERDKLIEQIILLHKNRFAAKSEKTKKLLDPNQLSLFDEAECFQYRKALLEEKENEDTEVPPSAAPAPRKKSHNKPGRKFISPALPRRVTVIDLSEEEKHCACGAQLRKIGEEVSEKLHHMPAKIWVEQLVRPKYICPCCEGTEDDRPTVRIAPMPPQLINRGIVTPSLLTHVIISKFADALPLYRQSKIFARLGVGISRSTMCSWLLKAAEVCEPLRDRFYQHLRSGPAINMDETPVQVLREAGRKNSTKSYMWVAKGGTADASVVLFTYAPTRSGKEPALILGNFKGFLQSDGYKGYEMIGNREGITHVGCLVHVRRKFVEASKAGSKKLKGTASMIIDTISDIYHQEKIFKEKALSKTQLREARQTNIKPLLDKIENLMLQAQPKVPSLCLLGKAIAYGLNQWRYILNYLECPDLTPDNNAAENAIRPFVVGRKNWLFSGSPRGADASALFYSMIESAKANGLNPQKYLETVLEKIPFAKTPADYDALMPWAMK